MMREHTEIYRDFTNHLLRLGTFPAEWKEATVILIHKPGKPVENPSSYRPICLLNTISKSFEKIINNRLQQELEQKNLLSDSQYGFRKGRSTIQAIERLLKTPRQELATPRHKRQLVLIVLLDIRNAFNSMSWRALKESISNLDISQYLEGILNSYLENRTIRCEDFRYEMSAGAPQGSMLAPTLWNIGYDEVVRAELPEGASIVAYADDLALVARARNEDILETITNLALEKYTVSSSNKD